MGFFKDFKQDLSQAVNELTDETVGMAAGDAQALPDDVMVDTLTAAEEEELNAAIDEGLKNLELESEPIPETPAVDEPVLEESPVVTPIEEEAQMDDSEAVSNETAIITPGLKIKGDIESTGSIELLGSVEGNVTCRGKLSASGTIVGNTQSREFFSDKAHIQGDINCDGPAKIGNGSVIKGALYATSAVIAGAIKGDVDVHGPVIIDTSAVVIGDIKSKSVQINNGAVIDGRVSQCYADLKPVTIFGED